MTNSDKRSVAKGMYIQDLYTRKNIAQTVGCAESTLRKWIEEDNWDVQKDAKSITRPQLLQDAYSQLASINKEVNQNHNGIPNKQLSDAKAVIRKEIEALSEMPIHQYTEVFGEFMQFLNDAHPKALQQHTAYMNEFIGELAVKRKIK